MNRVKQIKLASLVATLALSLNLFSFAAIVRAQDSTETEQDTTTTETEENESTQKPTLEERLKARKEALQTKLTNAQQNLLKARCKAAQSKVGPIRKNFEAVQKNRVSAYGKLEERLNTLVTKIGDRADTTKLQEQITVLSGKIDTLETALTNYKQAISDLEEVDCVNDPTGFKASLEEARTLLKQMLEASTDVKSYIKDTIKPTLVEIRTQLEASEGETTE